MHARIINELIWKQPHQNKQGTSAQEKGKRLIQAVEDDNTETVVLMLEAGADINRKSEDVSRLGLEFQCLHCLGFVCMIYLPPCLTACIHICIDTHTHACILTSGSVSLLCPCMLFLAFSFNFILLSSLSYSLFPPRSLSLSNHPCDTTLRSVSHSRSHLLSLILRHFLLPLLSLCTFLRGL